jgi:transcription antitermination factor NusA-like protein
MNPSAIHLLEKNLDKIEWCVLAENSAAIHLLEKNIDKIDWVELSKNPSIFKSNILSIFNTLTDISVNNIFLKKIENHIVIYNSISFAVRSKDSNGDHL